MIKTSGINSVVVQELGFKSTHDVARGLNFAGQRELYVYLKK
jgi:hypothetical protein